MMKMKSFWWWWTNLANMHTLWSLTHLHTASSETKVFMDGVYKLHGLPAIIVSDRDPIFLSQFWKQLFIHQGIDLHYSTVYYPQSNGQTKIINKFLENYLRGELPTNWIKWLSLAEWWYNTNFHTSTKATRYKVLYGLTPPTHIPYFPKDYMVEADDNYLTTREEMLRPMYNLLSIWWFTWKTEKGVKEHMKQKTLSYIKLQPYR